ncbi:MAG: cobyrinate a,c-diamide synthase [Gemmatimonadetes bacterium]|nr:cobyrinate a,c-diamide synthase [Gemmatimonadota bacterium]
MSAPRVLVAGLGGGGGKTLVSVGLTAAWRSQGREVAPFKKGPDYIDAAWLTQAAGRSCRNLDLFLMSRDTVVRSFLRGAADADVSVVEGNRGLYDGVDAKGTFSSAELAKLLRIPVVLVVDCVKTTRTVAAMVLGCQRLDSAVDIRGVVLNRVSGSRHESVLRDAVESACGVRVVGALPKLQATPFPERHLGLVPPDEHAAVTDAVHEVARAVAGHLDLDALWAVASAAPTVGVPISTEAPGGRPPENPVEVARVGVFRDAAFQFYYPENLEGLEREGAHLVYVSPLADAELPEVDALYVGGGFPETLAARLTDNASFRESVRRAVAEGLPVYAECGGAVYLGKELSMEGGTYPMAAALPVVFGMGEHPRGHGYTVLETVAPNPFYRMGDRIRGHEFHYTFAGPVAAEDVTFAFRVHRGYGFDGRRDGVCHRNVLASYTHVHALGVERWAPALVRAAVEHRSGRPGTATLEPAHAAGGSSS